MQATEPPPWHPYTSTLTRRGQVTIPVQFRRLLGLSAHDRVAFYVSDGQLRIEPAMSVADRTAGALQGYAHIPRATPQEEHEAFAQAVADEVAGQRDG